MKNKTNTFLNIIIIIFSISFVVFSAVYIANSLSFSKSNIELKELGANNANSEQAVDVSSIFSTIADEDYSLKLEEDGVYTLVKNSDNNALYPFSGGYVYKTGQDVLNVVPENDICKAGLNPEKINLNNLFVVKADYGQHNIPNGVEYYNKEIHDIEDPSFYFLIYFKQNNDKTYVAIHPLTDLSNVDFETSYF